MFDSRSGGSEDVRLVMRQPRNLGQMVAARTGGSRSIPRSSGADFRPVGVSSLDRFRLTFSSQQYQQHQMPDSGSGPSSVRALSPSNDRSGSGAMMGNFSAHSSITTGRHAGDAPIGTSKRKISKSAITKSPVSNQVSSTSDDLLSLRSGSRHNAKGKTRLCSVDRTAICEAARNNPKTRQEDLAARFGIERSTVSKTLKTKEKWLAVDNDSDSDLIVKHRAGKFPEVEECLFAWIQAEHPGDCLSDTAIKERNLEIAHDIGLSSEQFKASLGWIEKFRERYRILKPIVNKGEMVNEARRAQAFKSVVTLSTNYGDAEDRYVEEEGPSNVQQGGLQNVMPEAGGKEMVDGNVLLATQHHFFYGPHVVPTTSSPQRPR